MMSTMINKQRTVKFVSGITLTRIWTLGTYYLLDIIIPSKKKGPLTTFEDQEMRTNLT